MNAEAIPIAKFRLGLIYITPNALEKLSSEDISKAVRRHQSGDWGDVDEGDRNENELSLQKGFRLLSVYHSSHNHRFRLITEADRSMTTVSMPEDY